MGANMQRQAVPLLRPQAPIVGTGIERQAARDSGQVVLARGRRRGRQRRRRGRSSCVDDEGVEHAYKLRKFVRSNQGTCINQRPIVSKGDRVAKGQPIADSSSTENGELALGQNMLVAFMSWEGGNFEDAILISERSCARTSSPASTSRSTRWRRATPSWGRRRSRATSPTSARRACADLDERGIIYIGAEVRPDDILVGKITPKGETELTAEERLLRAIFGEKAREVKDTSLRVPHGEQRQGRRGQGVLARGQRRAARRRQPDGARLHRAEAQDRRGRQDGRPPRQQGRDHPRAADRGHAVPAGRHAGGHHPEPAGRAVTA